MATTVITHNGREVITTATAAARYGLTPAGMRSVIRDNGWEPVAELDGRLPLYDAEKLDADMKGRPGRGVRAS